MTQHRMTVVPSFVKGSWWTPESPSTGADVRDASTGEAIATVSDEGLDLACGGRLRPHRGPGLARHPHLPPARPRAQGARRGAERDARGTLRDLRPHRGDPGGLDGGHRRRHRRALHVRLEGAPRTAELPGLPRRPRRSCSPRTARSSASTSTRRIPGVAVQINAFNFPVWGMLEKFASAFLAGVPDDRQARDPDRLPRRSRRAPDGRLRHCCPPGRCNWSPAAPAACSSTSTTATWSPSPAPPPPPTGCVSTTGVVSGGVRFLSETDSLNASILGPDAVADTPEFDAFVKSLVTEMTVKAGQKCTSIRRAIVPVGLVDDVIGATAQRIASAHRDRRPARRGRHDGARSSAGNSSDEVLGRVRELVAAGGEIVIGVARGTGRAPRRRHDRHRPGRRVHGAGAAALRGCRHAAPRTPSKRSGRSPA